MNKNIWLLLAYIALPLSAEEATLFGTKNFQLKQKVSQAITKFEQSTKENWAYQVSRYENEEGDITSSIEQFMPSSDEHEKWTLKLINGKKPTEKQALKFSKNKQEQVKKKEKGANYSMKLRKIINQDSLELISENISHINMRFNVYLSKLGEDSIGKLQGSLSYNKQLAFIEKITIVNNEEFSPMFSANITDLSLTFTFVSINNDILPKQHNMEMKGTFAYFTDINEVSTDTYSDYSYKGIN